MSDLSDLTTEELHAELARRSQAPAFQAAWEASSKVGSCNLCDRYIRTDPPHVRAHKVLRITGRRVEFRICHRCWEHLRAAARWTS